MEPDIYQTITCDIQGPVVRITLNRPEKFNALSETMMDELTHGLAQLSAETTVRVVVLCGAGKHFCAGFDLGENADGLADRPVEDGMRLQHKAAAIIQRMRSMSQPIVALIQGAACGAGFSMSMAADIRVAAEDAKFNAAYLRIGLTGCDMGAGYLLPRLVGTSVASELLLTGNFIHAQRALAVNLVSAVVPNSKLDDAAHPYIEGMLSASPMGLRLTKESLNYAVDAQSLDAAMAMENRQQVLVGQSRDHREAVHAFLEKRPPKYEGG